MATAAPWTGVFEAFADLPDDGETILGLGLWLVQGVLTAVIAQNETTEVTRSNRNGAARVTLQSSPPIGGPARPAPWALASFCANAGAVGGP